MSHTVSIAMTTYNGERFLREQLDSIYSQTLLPNEIVVCDDNSTDRTVKILEEYKKKYGLRYYVNNPRLGVNENFYKAISLCTSDYIALSDQDDIWLPNKIEITYKKLLEIDNGKPSVVSSTCHDIDASGNFIKKRPKMEDSFGYAATLLTSGHNQGCSLMMNKEMAKLALNLKNKDSRVKTIMFDAFISFLAAILGNKYNLGTPLMLYRHHDSNVVAKVQTKRKNIIERAKVQDVYVGFIPDVRFRALKIITDILGEEISNQDIRKLLEKLEAINNSSFPYGLLTICKLSELSNKQKKTILIKSLICKIIKTI